MATYLIGRTHVWQLVWLGVLMCGNLFDWAYSCVATYLIGRTHVWQLIWLGVLMSGNLFDWAYSCVATYLIGRTHVWQLIFNVLRTKCSVAAMPLFGASVTLFTVPVCTAVAYPWWRQLWNKSLYHFLPLFYVVGWDQYIVTYSQMRGNVQHLDLLHNKYIGLSGASFL